MARYAQSASVDSAASRVEIERILTRYGATRFMYGWIEDRAVIAFVARGRQVRFMLPMPDKNERRFTHTPAKGMIRTAEAAAKEFFPYLVLPNNRIVFEEAGPNVALAYETGRVKPLLQLDP